MDQTKFNQEQEVLQPPPKKEAETNLVNPDGIVNQAEPGLGATSTTKPNRIKLYSLLAGLGVGSLVIVIFVVYFLFSDSNTAEDILPKVNQPRPNQTEESEVANEFQQELNQVRQQIDQADPVDVPLEPAQLDYNISL